MNKIVKIIIFLIFVLVVLFILVLNLPKFRLQSNRESSIQSGQKLKTAKVCFIQLEVNESSDTHKQNKPLTGFRENCFLVEVSKTPFDKERGLMFRNYLKRDKGMLFIFDNEDLYSFWMKNTLIPLDMIWINQNQKVVFIKENALPCQQNGCPLISPDQKAKYVLEINSGVSNEINLKLGDRVYLEF